MNSRLIARIGLLALATLLPGCSRQDLSGPPELRIGRDECGECGMIVSEDRCSSALLVEQGGRREHILFDDIGCMLDYERDKSDRFIPVDAFVHDHGTKAWLRAADASFLYADRTKLLTPMGTGIVAFAASADARSIQQEVGGEVMDYAGLAIARRDWMWARYGKPAGAP
jgi:nitrous oxide reductase accessory protein NosL